jgi:PPK2 family polyphosphate:nucleotide phosphotransferase
MAEKFYDKYLVKKGGIFIADYNSDEKLDMGKEAAKLAHAENVSRMNELQQVMYAEGKHKLLVVLQAMDTAGKDSTIRQVFGLLNPQGVDVNGFKQPTKEDLAHDYLWRVHKHVPGNGQISIFNRSHYEDVLCVKVHDWASEKDIKKRYGHIADFERMLNDTGTNILKFYLNIDLDEQKERLQDRLDVPEKNWKFSKGDLSERALWEDYMEAYETAMGKTSTKNAPWFIVPANRKWVRNYVISSIVKDTLESMKMKYPEPEEGLDQIVIN